MNRSRKLSHLVLFGLVLLFFVMSPFASAETDPVILCIDKYQTEKGLSYDEAKKLCTVSQNQTPVVTSVQRTTTQTPVQTPRTAVEDECIKKYMDVYGLTYENAKAKCYPVPTPTPYASPAQDPVIECIAKYQKEKGLSYDEAKRLCTGLGITKEETSAVLPQAYQIINRCGELEKKLYYLIEKLNSAQGQEAASLTKDIEILKTELKRCEVKEEPVAKPIVIPPKVDTTSKNPCEEAEVLKQTLEHIKKKIDYVEELVAKGEMDKSELGRYYKEYEYLKQRLEKMNFACQQGKPVEESPCARLSKLELIYREINDKLQGTQDEKSRLELSEKLASVAREIAALKQKCKAEKLGTEKDASLYDIEKAYRAKQKITVEETSGKNLQAELAKIEEEKNKLLLEFAQKMQVLDARQTTILKKLEIKGGNIYLDDIKSKATRIKVDVKERNIEIEPTASGMAIIDGDIQAQGDIPLEYAGGMLKSAKSGKEIKVMPSELKNKTFKDTNLTDLELIDDGKPEYLAKSEKKGKFLGFIPTTVRREYRISAESGIVTETSAPWWSALVSE
ncbi:MAG: hypothetical protein Q7U60_07930 [Candidatus Methanoperedens sp.]|nr:hypothetical protein [Candidatus Methanoperedens sp.]